MRQRYELSGPIFMCSNVKFDDLTESNYVIICYSVMNIQCSTIENIPDRRPGCQSFLCFCEKEMPR